jgi:hypothetical protein
MDFEADKNLFDPAYRAQVVDRAVLAGQSGFGPLQVVASSLRGKPVYQLAHLSDLLVVRHLTAGVRRITGVRQDNRQFIVECIRALLADGTAFRVFKFDIKSFYESVKIDDVLGKLRNDAAFSGQSSRALDSLFTGFRAVGI